MSEHFQQYKTILQCFFKMVDEPTSEQIAMVDSGLGKVDGISRFEMAKVLYSAYFSSTTLRKEIRRFYIFVKYIFNKQKMYQKLAGLEQY